MYKICRSCKDYKNEAHDLLCLQCMLDEDNKFKYFKEKDKESEE